MAWFTKITVSAALRIFCVNVFVCHVFTARYGNRKAVEFCNMAGLHAGGNISIEGFSLMFSPGVWDFSFVGLLIAFSSLKEGFSLSLTFFVEASTPPRVV